jgi:hypothetical protein
MAKGYDHKNDLHCILCLYIRSMYAAVKLAEISMPL